MPIFDASAFQNHLLGVARTYAKSLQGRPGLVGTLLYGSLIRGELTQFSDIDLAIFYGDTPPCRIEHRVVNGVKVDLIAFPMADVTALLDPLPASLDVGFPFSYVLESLLLGDGDSLLYDPTGELKRVKTRLGEQLSYAALNRASLRRGYRDYYLISRDEARSLLKTGDFGKALDNAQGAGWGLEYLLGAATLRKDTRKAAEELGIPDFAGKAEELAALLAPALETAEAVLADTQALWNYSLGAAMPLVRDCLGAKGIAKPDRLELIGDHNLFWPGERLHEFGRVISEVDLSLRWCRADMDAGRGATALQRLWACRGSEGIRRRLGALANALNGAGYDCAAPLETMISSAEFTRLAERLDQATRAAERTPATPAAAHHALALTEEMERLLLSVIPLSDSDAL